MANTDYFIRVHNPKQTRKLILENTRDILRVLQGYEDFKAIRAKRHQLVNAFTNNINETRGIILEVKKMLPKVSIKETGKIVRKVEVEKPIKEIKKLEQELADIEEKLSSI